MAPCISDFITSVLLPGKRAPSAERGSRKKAAARCARRRVRHAAGRCCRRGASPARGGASSSRSSCRARGCRSTIASTARVDGGSRLAVGSSRNSTSGASAHARASARRCCSPPESTRAGRPRHRARPTLVNALVDAAPRFAPAHAAQRERMTQVGRGGAAQQHGPLEHHRLAARTRRESAPGHAAPRSARSARAARAAACSCRRRWRQDERARPRRDREVDAIEHERRAAHDVHARRDDRQPLHADLDVTQGAPSPIGA